MNKAIKTEGLPKFLLVINSVSLCNAFSWYIISGFHPGGRGGGGGGGGGDRGVSPPPQNLWGISPHYFLLIQKLNHETCHQRIINSWLCYLLGKGLVIPRSLPLVDIPKHSRLT